MREHREQKRLDALERNSKTQPGTWTEAYRRGLEREIGSVAVTGIPPAAERPTA